MWVCCVRNGINSAPTRVCCVWNGINSAPTSILRKDIANERNANLFPCRGVIFSQAQQLVSRSYQQFNDLRDTMESCRGVIYHVPIIHVFVLPYEKRKSSCVVAFQACTERTKTSAPTRVCCVWNGINSAPTSILRKDIANERNANLFPCRGVIYHVPISHVFVFPYEKRKSSC